jgi:mono/diheme cytochrome c family protein/glucose/arabinose dehydrogenase
VTTPRFAGLALVLLLASVPAQQEIPVLSPEQELRTFRLPAGYRVELVASEPLVQDPVAIDFDADGRLWVVEMRGFMPNLEGQGESAPLGRIVVLEDSNDDGRMDRKTIYLDSLMLPRALKVLDRGVLVGAPPYLWLTRDTTGDLVADSREVVAADFGDPEGNPEHNANGLVWGLDNWIHTAAYDGRFRARNGRIELERSAKLGQWGVGLDEFGRIYRNSNEDPLHVDLVPPQYFARNRNLTRTRGAYENAAGGNQPVWPAHATPAVNRGYRSGVLRPDSSLARFTSAGSPVVYVGDRLPAELHNNVFVTESAGNLVHRFVIRETRDGGLRATSAYARAEFLASTHERFRPVNLYSAPDGTLYVVDMYRGIIQHRAFITGYLEEQIRQRGLEQPVGLGRIWRVMHDSTQRDRKPSLSREPASGLVAYLTHANGWWRRQAQQLLVERGDRSVVPELTRLARDHDSERVRLHALWTLDGLNAADPETVTFALSDRSAHVRAAAVRIAEPRFTTDDSLRARVTELLQDSVAAVRWQVIATLGQMPPPERLDRITAVLARAGNDALAVDVAISGLPGQEFAALEQLLGGTGAAAEPISRLAATVMKAADSAQVQSLLAWTGQSTLAPAQRLALLNGIIAVLPRAATADEENTAPATLKLTQRPAGLFAAVASADTAIRERAARVLRLADWPGKPAPPRATVRPLTAAEQQRFQAGQRVYRAHCEACHQPTGLGLPGVANRLAGSRWVTGTAGLVIRIVLHGKDGPMLMPPVGGSLSDAQVADVLTYIRRAWGNQANPVRAVDVAEIRGYSGTRKPPWSEAELERIRR